MQLYRFIYYSYSALHVSGDVFAHHQEHLTFALHVKHNTINYEFVIEVNTTRYCKYSQVLLMMDENIARNM